MVMAGVPLSFIARVTGRSTLSCAARYGKHAPQDAAKMAIRALEGAGNGGAEGGPEEAARPVATAPAAPGTDVAPVATGVA